MKGIIKSIGIVMVLTLLSRFFALASNQIYLVKLGIMEHMDAFTYALGLPNIVFAGLGTALTTVVVPLFAGFREKGEDKRAFSFVSNITGLAVMVTSILAIIGIALTPILVNFTRFNNSSAYSFATFSIRAMLPVMIIYGITYIFQGVLQASGRFVAPSIVSLPSSFLVIIYVIFLGEKYGVKGLLFATIIGLSLQALIMVPSIYKTGFRFKLSFNIRDKDLVSAMKLIPPVFIGAAAWQVNMMYNLTLAANFENGTTLVSLVQNLITSGVLTLVYSVTAVIFPKLTVLFTKNEMVEFKEVFRNSVGSTLFFVIPIALGFVTVGRELLSLIYGWGKITEGNIEMAGMIMAFYAIGIVGHSVKEIADRAFYSVKNTVLPALNGLVIMVINVLASLIFIRKFGVYGIPLAYSISLTVGAMVILIMLKRDIGSFGAKELIIKILKIILSGGIMTVGILIIKKIVYNITLGTVFMERLMILFVPIFAGVIIYFIMGVILNLSEAKGIYNRIKKVLG